MRHPDYTAQQDSVKGRLNESSEEYQFEAEESPRTFFTITPNVLIKLKLSPSAFQLYVYYRSIGNCFKKKNTITQEMGLSRSTILRANAELKKPRKELGGLPLIRILEQKRADGSDAPNKVIIVDIWQVNHETFTGKPDEIKEKFTEVQNEPGRGSKRTCINKIPSQQERNVKGVPAKRVEEKPKKPTSRRRSRVDKPANIPKVLQDMEDFGVPFEEQQKIANMGFSEQVLTEACLGMVSKIHKGEDILNPSAYLTHACNQYHDGTWKIGWKKS